MNQREKILAGLIGVIVVCGVLYYGAGIAMSTLDARDETIMELESQVRKQENIKNKGMKDAKKLNRFRDQSLPEDVHIASRVYRDWWLRKLNECRINDPNVQAMPRTRVQGDAFKVSTFSVTGSGDLQQVTRMLHEFHSADYLHRLRSIRLTPQTDSEELMISMTIDALSVKGATSIDKLVERKSNVLNLGPLEAYEDVIVERNFFAPGNNPPKFASVREQEIYRGQRESISVRADPGDKNQRVNYQIVSHTLPGDAPDVSSSGTIRLQVDENGQYEIVLLATDSGMPAKTDQVTIPVTVVDPPPPREVRPPPPPPRFNEARFAYITTLMEINGEPQMWLSVRTTGELLKLNEGDKFEIGNLEGVVSRINFDLREVEMEWNGQAHRVRRGQNLDQAQVIAD